MNELNDKIEEILVKAVALHNQRGKFDDVDKIMLGKWSEEIQALITEQIRLGRTSNLEIYKELWNRITPSIVPDGWEPDKVQLFVKQRIEELQNE